MLVNLTIKSLQFVPDLFLHFKKEHLELSATGKIKELIVLSNSKLG